MLRETLLRSENYVQVRTGHFGKVWAAAAPSSTVSLTRRDQADSPHPHRPGPLRRFLDANARMRRWQRHAGADREPHLVLLQARHQPRRPPGGSHAQLQSRGARYVQPRLRRPLSPAATVPVFVSLHSWPSRLLRWVHQDLFKLKTEIRNRCLSPGTFSCARPRTS